MLFTVLGIFPAVDGEGIAYKPFFFGIAVFFLNLACGKGHHIDAEKFVRHLHGALSRCEFYIQLVVIFIDGEIHRHGNRTKLDKRPLVGVQFHGFAQFSVTELSYKIDLKVCAHFKEQRPHRAPFRALSGLPGVVNIQETVKFGINTCFCGNTDGIHLCADKTYPDIYKNADSETDHTKGKEIGPEVGCLDIFVRRC